jgi:hypothetical protein
MTLTLTLLEAVEYREGQRRTEEDRVIEDEMTRRLHSDLK